MFFASIENLNVLNFHFLIIKRRYPFPNFPPQNNATPSFVKKTLKYSLLPHESEGDQIVSALLSSLRFHEICAGIVSFLLSYCSQAALSVWITILRFMQDIPDAKEISYDKVYS